MRPGDYKSLVWQYFEMSENGEKVTCNMCGKKLSRTNSSTGNMLRHVIRQHHIPIESAFNEKLSPPKRKRKLSNQNTSDQQAVDFQLSIVKEVGSKTTGIVKAGNSSNQNDSELNGKIVSDMLLDVVVGDGHDFSILHGKYFKRFVENILFGFDVPEESFFIEKMQEHYESLRTQLKELINFGEGASLTLEKYTALDNSVFVSLSVNFFSSFSHTNESYVVAAKKLSHVDTTTERLEMWMKGILTKFNIKFSQVVSVCCAENEKDLLGILSRDLCNENGWYFHACPIQILKEIVNEGFENIPGVANAIQICRDVIKYFDTIPNIFEDIDSKKQEFTTAFEQAKQGLQLDKENNWLSTLHMLEQILGVQWQLSMIFSDESISAERPDLSNISWKVLTALKDAIQPLKVAHDIMNGEKYTTLATLQPVVMGVMKQLKTNLSSTSLTAIVSFCEFTIKKLQTIFEFENLQASTCLKATFLDPRYKTATMSPELARIMKSKIELELESENSPDSSNSLVPPSLVNDSQEQLLNFAFTNESSSLNVTSEEVVTMSLVTTVNEVQEYLNTPKLALNGEPLQFWKSNTETFPVLSQLARRYLCLPASSKSSLKQYINTNSEQKLEYLLKSPHMNELYFLCCNNYMSD